MVKRTLIAMALVALLMTTANAVVTPSSGPAAYKVDETVTEELTLFWPYEITVTYQALPICVVPVNMKVGYFVKVVDCDELSILLEQVTCADAADFPCYHGCTDVTVVTNFPVILGQELALDPAHSVFVADNIACSLDGGDDVTISPTGDTVELCVDGKAADLSGETPMAEIHVADVTLTVKPATCP